MADELSSKAVSVIEMRDVSASSLRDSDSIIAEQVNWSVMAEEFWVIAGLQGTGKSDFLMMTAGLMPPASGTYTLFDEAMPIFDEHRLKHRLRLGLVFESGQLFNHLTVMENVALPMRYHRNISKAEAESEAGKWLEAMELGPWADSTPGAIGRNWQKRVGLARALVLRPEVLLLDNPLAGIDLRHARWWQTFLRDASAGHALLNDKKLTIIATANDLRPWRNLARRFAILREKTFTVLGNWSQLETASSELVRELLPMEAH